MSEEGTPCPKCKSPYGYEVDSLLVCPECNYEWNPAEIAEILNTVTVIRDSNGNVLQHGDTVVITKDLPVKGFLRAIKSGTKVKNIRLIEDGDHNIDCKVDGFGAMALKSEFVRKA